MKEASSSEIPVVAPVPRLRSPSLEILEDRTTTQPVYRNQDGVEIVGEPRPTNKSRKLRENQVSRWYSPSTEVLPGISAMETPIVPPRSPSLEILEERTIHSVQPGQHNQDNIEIIGAPQPTNLPSQSYKRKRL